MKKYIEPNVKTVSLASEETMAAVSAQVDPTATPVDPSTADAKSTDISPKSVWEE